MTTVTTKITINEQIKAVEEGEIQLGTSKWLECSPTWRIDTRSSNWPYKRKVGYALGRIAIGLNCHNIERSAGCCGCPLREALGGAVEAHWEKRWVSEAHRKRLCTLLRREVYKRKWLWTLLRQEVYKRQAGYTHFMKPLMQRGWILYTRLALRVKPSYCERLEPARRETIIDNGWIHARCEAIIYDGWNSNGEKSQYWKEANLRHIIQLTQG